MFEAAIPQNDNDLNAEKGPGCDVRHRVALSAVYNPPSWNLNALTRTLTRDWRGSMEFQVQTGFPLTISVFGDTANAGTVVGENPIRANLTGAARISRGHAECNHMVQSRGFCRAARVHLRRRGPQLRLRARNGNDGRLELSAISASAEKARFETRAEFFNALNHTNLGTPNRFVNTSSFGSITEITTPGREIQLSARISF